MPSSTISKVNNASIVEIARSNYYNEGKSKKRRVLFFLVIKIRILTLYFNTFIFLLLLLYIYIYRYSYES